MARCIGIDIAKATLDADVAGTLRHLPNSKQGWKKLLKALAVGDIAVIEATGGYERGCVKALRAGDFAVAVVNPADVAHFRKGMGFQSKTDRIDAQVLSRFGEARKLTGQQAPENPELADLVARRNQLVSQCAAEKTRLEHADGEARKSVKRTITWLKREIKRVEKLIKTLIAENGELKRKAEILASAPGVGPATSALLLAAMPELGKMSPRQAASLAGLAPHPRESGAWQGIRRIGRGRVSVRRGLFMAVMGGMKGNNELSRIVTALKANGKAPKQAIIAAARRLLTVLNAMLRENKMYDAKLFGTPV